MIKKPHKAVPMDDNPGDAHLLREGLHIETARVGCMAEVESFVALKLGDAKPRGGAPSAGNFAVTGGSR